jgi:outer membrane protein assembly factor BamB
MSLALVASIVALVSSSPSESSDWPQWRGSLGDGLSHGASWGSEGKTLWTAEIGLGYSAPAVVGGRVLAYGHDAERSLDVLRCLDGSSGRELWRAEAPGELRANQHEGGTLTSPAVAAERVYVLSTSGLVSCHALADGALVWRVDLVERHGVEPAYYGFAASPVVGDGRLYLAAGRALALDPATGATLWATEPIEAQYATPAPCTLGDAPRLALFTQRGLHLLERADGKELALFPFHDADRLVNAATPVVVGSRLFVSSAYEHGCALVEFAPEGPRALFRNKAMRNKMAGCVLLDGHLYGFDESVLKCLDLEGNERWRVRGLGSGAIAGGDGKLAVLSSGGELVVARATPAAFEELARTPLFEEGVCWTPPVIANGRIWCRNNRGTLVCREQREPGARAAAPTVAGTVAGAPGALPEAAALLARHLAAIGGAEALAKHPHLRLAGVYEQRSVGFVPAPFEIRSSAPDRRRVHIQLPPPLDEMFAHEGVPGHLARVHDGTESFELNRYRGDKLYTGGEAREEAVAARLPFAREASALGTTLVTEARLSFDERDCWRVAATTADGRRRTLYFEAATGLLAGREAEDEALVLYRDYRAFDGLSLATSVRAFRPDGGIEEHFRIEQVSFEEPPAGTFARSERVEELLGEARAR